jgi:uncharacterized protein (DUF736 family)
MPRVRPHTRSVATWVTIDAFTPDEAVEYLSRRLGDPRVAAEPAAAARLAANCSYLPLALHLLCSRLAERPQWSLADAVGPPYADHDAVHERFKRRGPNAGPRSGSGVASDADQPEPRQGLPTHEVPPARSGPPIADPGARSVPSFRLARGVSAAVGPRWARDHPVKQPNLTRKFRV